MRTGNRSGIVALAGLAVLVFGWFVLAPVQLGGSMLYTATVGDSMEPLFHKGDLALVRTASTYRVGEIVLYQSPILQRPVLHRILVIQHGHYYFKGDHNDFVDPGYATRSQLRGKLSYRIPHAGKALNWFAAPLHAALLAGLAVIFLLLGGGGATASRRRRRGRKTSGRRQPVRTGIGGRFHRPRKSAENIVGGVGLVLAAVLLGVGFTTPLRRPAPVVGFMQKGDFSYHAKVVRPATAYPTGRAQTGQPLFLNAFKLVTVGFTYRFDSRLPHSVHGTIGLKAIISSDAGLRNTYALQKAKPFAGDTATVGGTFDVQQLRGLITQLSIDSGAAGSSYAVELVPVVTLSGLVGTQLVHARFSPTLPFTVDQTVLKLNIAAPVAAPGATYAPPSSAQTLAGGLRPSQTGNIHGFAPNYSSFARYHFPISLVRGVGLGLAGLALIVLLSKLFKPPREIWSHEKRIAFRHGCVVVDVVSFGADRIPARSLSEVTDFESLATLAKYCERPILRETRDGLDAYAVEDDGRLYVHRPPAAPATPVEIVAARPVPDFRRDAPRPRRQVLRSLAALLTLGVAVGVVSSFTATNTVPLSRAGSSAKPLFLDQLMPSQCAGIIVTNVVFATSSTTTGTAGNDLILGRSASGIQNIVGGGGTDCLVGGGDASTTSKFDASGGTGAVCLGAVAAKNIFKGCAKQYN